MTVTATSPRERLTNIRQETHEARTARARARTQLDAARDGGDLEAAAIAQLAFDNADERLQRAERLESMLLSSMAGIESNGYGGNGFGDSVFNNPEAIGMLERLGSSQMPIGRLDLGPMHSREDVVAMIESGRWGPNRLAAGPDTDIGDPARTGAYYGIRPQLRRRLSILDLLNTAGMSGGSFFYTQESGNLDTAAEVSEGQIKPAGDLVLDDAEVKAATIAHWLRLKRPQLQDVPDLATTVTQRLTYGVMLRLDTQVLVGDGVGQNILGILNQPGIGDVPNVAGDPLTDLTLDGITATFLVDADPNGVVAHPTDVAAMLKNKSVGSGIRLDSDGAFATPPTQMWGLPLVISRAITQGTALVGDFNQATLFVREGVNLRISDADQDAFVRNEVVFLAEGRWGLAVWAPVAFSVVHFA